MAQAGTQTRTASFGPAALEQLAQLRVQRLEAIGVAEEIGDADQQVLQQRVGFAGAGAQAVEVGRQVGSRR